MNVCFDQNAAVPLATNVLKLLKLFTVDLLFPKLPPNLDPEDQHFTNKWRAVFNLFQSIFQFVIQWNNVNASELCCPLVPCVCWLIIYFLSTSSQCLCLLLYPVISLFCLYTNPLLSFSDISHTCFLLFCPSHDFLCTLLLLLLLHHSHFMAFHLFWKKGFFANICPTVSVEPSASIWAQPGLTCHREGWREDQGSVHEKQQCRNKRDLGFSLFTVWL